MSAPHIEAAAPGATHWEAKGDEFLHEGRRADAASCYRQALLQEPDRSSSRLRLASLLVEIGQTRDSLPLWHAELARSACSLTYLQQLVTEKVQARDLPHAGEYALISAALRRASRWFPEPGDEVLSAPVQRPEPLLSVAKLRHDIGQFRYLRHLGRVGPEFDDIIANHERVLSFMIEKGPDARVPVEGEIESVIGDVYGRIVHLREALRVERALSDEWNPADVESAYIACPPGLVVIDNFLTPEALEGVRAFAVESTVWFANRYAYGRLGAFFHEGFSCPLLVQIAEEIRDAFPRMIGDRYPLRQLWGFKNSEELPADATVHADFAAVNVNFWITPNDANLDPESGGMVIYGVDAPSHWDFETYNGKIEVIKPFLQRRGATSITVPYRQNRAVVFNSDLFHATAKVRFRPEYENHRINITMLYGDRADDVHHRSVSPEHPTVASTAWRSAAFRRSRGTVRV